MKISDISIDKEITLPGEDYEVIYISDEKKEIYFRTRLVILPYAGDSASYEIRKRSAGRSRTDAQRKCERLIYKSYISRNTLFLDEFFTIPSDSKWSFDFVSVTLYIPEGTIVCMDNTVEKLFHSYDDDDYSSGIKNRLWRMTDDGLYLLGPDQGK
jgi:hypothetical protein